MLWVNSGGLTNRIASTWFAKLAKHRLQRGVFPWCNPADAVDRGRATVVRMNDLLHGSRKLLQGFTVTATTWPNPPRPRP